jgi:nucleoside 2-deoxyribosyltransferase
MGRLLELDWDHIMVYLCGPMDFAKDLGVKWRDDATEKLLGLGMLSRNILNPCSKPLSHLGAPLSEEQKLANDLREKGDWDGLEQLARRIIHVDLRMVDKADFLIVNLSDCERTTGTIHEIVIASLQQKPIYIIDNKGKSHVSMWLLGLVGHNRVYNTLDEVIEEIRKIKEKGPTSRKDAKQFLIFDFDKRDTDE